MKDLNSNQAYLYLENEIFLSNSTAEQDALRSDMKVLKESGTISVRGTLIVIVSYNACYMMQKNIESIRNTLPKGTYKIFVVDNASTDGVTEWLKEQDDILLICNKENIGFGPACNQAVQATVGTEYESYDVFLLNNDTRLAKNSLFWLRMGLYSEEKIGATGSISNYAGNEQQVDLDFSMPGDYLAYGEKNNVPMEYPYEERVRLCGFAMLIRRDVWNLVRGMDEEFAPGYIEDDDLSVRIMMLGYRLLVCKNSFIYHAGSQSFAKVEGIEELYKEHLLLFRQKHKFDLFPIAHADRETIDSLSEDKTIAVNMLQIECGLGADLKYFQSTYPNANVVGVEYRTELYEIANKTNVVFHSIDELACVITQPVFNVLFIRPEIIPQLSADMIDVINRLCLPGCLVIPKKNL